MLQCRGRGAVGGGPQSLVTVRNGRVISMERHLVQQYSGRPVLTNVNLVSRIK